MALFLFLSLSIWFPFGGWPDPLRSRRNSPARWNLSGMSGRSPAMVCVEQIDLPSYGLGLFEANVSRKQNGWIYSNMWFDWKFDNHLYSRGKVSLTMFWSLNMLGLHAKSASRTQNQDKSRIKNQNNKTHPMTPQQCNMGHSTMEMASKLFVYVKTQWCLPLSKLLLLGTRLLRVRMAPVTTGVTPFPVHGCVIPSSSMPMATRKSHL